MKLFHKIKDSIYNPNFYSSVKHEPFKRGFGYFIVLHLIQALVISIVMWIALFPFLNSAFSKKTVESLVSNFPADLQVTIKNGQASTNVTEPYAIPLPNSWATSAVATSSQIKNLMVIDTRTPFTLDKFYSSHAYIYLSQSYIVSYKNSQEVSVQTLPLSLNATIDRNQVSGLAEKIAPWLSWLIPIIDVGFLIMNFVLSTIGAMIGLVILSFLAWLVIKLSKGALNFAQTYKVGFYCSTLPIIFKVILSICGIGFSWYFFVIVFYLSMIANLKSKSA